MLYEQAIFALHASGQLRSVICRTFAFPALASALRAISGRRTWGKVLLHPQRLELEAVEVDTTTAASLIAAASSAGEIGAKLSSKL